MAVPLAGVLAGTPLKAGLTGAFGWMTLDEYGSSLPLIGGLFGEPEPDTDDDQLLILLGLAAVAIVLFIGVRD